MSNTTTTPAAADNGDNGDNGNLVPIADLEGADLTRAVRAWARDNGHKVSDRGAVPPSLVAKAVMSGATVDPATLDDRTRYVLTDTDGNEHVVVGPKGKATLDGLAESIGLTPEEVAAVTRNGELWELPRRASVAVAPWVIRCYDEETRTTFDVEYVSQSRGRLNPAAVAVACGVPVRNLVSATRDGRVLLLEATYRFTDGA